MQATRYKAFTEGNFKRAVVLEQLVYWAERTKYKDDFGRPYMIPRFSKMAAALGMTKGTLSKAITWLAEQGFISKTYIYLYRLKRVKIRLLFRPKETPLETPLETGGNTPGNSSETVYTPETSDNTKGIPAPATAVAVLKGSLEGISGRLKQRQSQGHARAHEGPLKARQLAIIWRRKLAEYGYPTINLDDVKVLSAVSKAATIFGSKDYAAFEAELNTRFLKWPSVRPKNMWKQPPHPWRLNRCAALFETGALECTDVAPDLKSPIVQKAVDKSLEEPQKPMQKDTPVLEKKQSSLAAAIGKHSKGKGK